MTASPLTSLTDAELTAFRTAQQQAYDALVARGLSLDLTRGKPSSAQLDLSDGLLDLPTRTTDASGVDVRNYGGLVGITEIRQLFAELLNVDVDQIVAQGNSSLALMREVLTFLMLKGDGTNAPWAGQPVKFLCPVPGYDRHFALLEWLGIEMIPIPMKADGPDADKAAELAGADASIKGMWVVPTYANPTGDVTSVEIATKLASMPTAAPDFKIFWDNAYALHHLSGAETKSADIVALSAVAGNPGRPIMFASTSKVTYAGAGVAFLAGSRETIAWYSAHLGFGCIGPDKVNQLRHVEFFKDADGVRAHMAKHRDLLAPKFAELSRILDERLSGYEVANWTHPLGGYFISLDVLDGTASRVIELAKAAGVALTPAGSAFPYKNDPDDRNIRLAPSLPPIEEVTGAAEVIATCVLLAASEKVGS